MNSEAFVKAIKKAVCETAADGTIKLLQRPPGRRPDAQLVALSDWYLGLSSLDRANVAKAVGMAADQATYNFLSALDGLLAIEPMGPKGRLELFHRNGNEATLLNSDDEEELTILYKSHGDTED